MELFVKQMDIEKKERKNFLNLVAFLSDRQNGTDVNQTTNNKGSLFSPLITQ